MEFLKGVISDELYTKLETELEGKGIKLANLATGDYVSKGKHEKVEALLATAKADLLTANGKIEEYESKNLTEEQKAQKAIADAERQKRDFQVAINRLKAENLLTKKGVQEDVYSALLDKFVSEDEEATISAVTAFSEVIESQRKAAEQLTKESLVKNNPSIVGGQDGDKEPTVGSFGADLAKSMNPDSGANDIYFKT